MLTDATELKRKIVKDTNMIENLEFSFICSNLQFSFICSNLP